MGPDDVPFWRTLLTHEFALTVSIFVGMVVLGSMWARPHELVFIGGLIAGAILEAAEDLLSDHARERLSGEDENGQ